MAKKNDTTETLDIPVVRGEGGKVDIEAFLLAAEEFIVAFRDSDADGMEKIGEVIDSILSNDRYKTHKSFNASTLAKLSLGILGEMPTDKAEQKIAGQVKAYLLGKGDSIFYIQAGRNAGFHVKERYSAVEFAKLSKAE